MSTARRIRPLRGQVVIREHHDPSGLIIAPPQFYDERAKRPSDHRGEVLAMGPPAQLPNGVEVPHGFEVGDTVLFHWEHHEAGNTREWSDGQPACWVPQWAVDAVIA
jgi:co-chaperonin GroES (HSP10)